MLINVVLAAGRGIDWCLGGRTQLPTRTQVSHRQNDEWLVCRRYLSDEALALVIQDQGDEGREEMARLGSRMTKRRKVTPPQAT